MHSASLQSSRLLKSFGSIWNWRYGRVVLSSSLRVTQMRSLILIHGWSTFCRWCMQCRHGWFTLFAFWCGKAVRIWCTCDLLLERELHAGRYRELHFTCLHLLPLSASPLILHVCSWNFAVFIDTASCFVESRRYGKLNVLINTSKYISIIVTRF